MKPYGPLFLVFSLIAADVWDKKPFTDWSQKEVDHMLTSSPWARETAAAFAGGGGAGGTGGGGRGGGRGGGGGGMGGDGGGSQVGTRERRGLLRDRRGEIAADGHGSPGRGGTVKKSGPWIPSVTVGVRKWLITNPDREGGDVKSNGQIDFFTVPDAVG